MPSLLLHETSLTVYETNRFEYFAKHCSLATWQRIVEQSPNHLESQQLQDSFKAWAQARTDAKFESQAQLDCRPAYLGIGPEGDLNVGVRHQTSSLRRSGAAGELAQEVGQIFAVQRASGGLRLVETEISGDGDVGGWAVFAPDFEHLEVAA